MNYRIFDKSLVPKLGVSEHMSIGGSVNGEERKYDQVKLRLGW